MTFKNKFVYLMGLYAEVGVNFGEVLPWEKTSEWGSVLDKFLLPEGKMLKNYKDYHIDLTITSTALSSDFKVMGPSIGRRNKSLTYAIWIPYAPVISAPNPLTKLTEYFKQGIAEVLHKLEYPEESIEKVLKNITDTPIT
jgi:hypothetical protein